MPLFSSASVFAHPAQYFRSFCSGIVGCCLNMASRDAMKYLARAQTLVLRALVQRKRIVADDIYVPGTWGFAVSRMVLPPGFISSMEEKRLRPNPGATMAQMRTGTTLSSPVDDVYPDCPSCPSRTFYSSRQSCSGAPFASYNIARCRAVLELADHRPRGPTCRCPQRSKLGRR